MKAIIIPLYIITVLIIVKLPAVRSLITTKSTHQLTRLKSRYVVIYENVTVGIR
jgi:hypothetical protein